MVLAYRHGLAYPSVDVGVELHVPEEVNLEQIDHFLLRSLRVPAEDLVAQEPADLTASAVSRYVMRILHARSALLRIGHLPIFWPGVILSIKPLDTKSNIWRVQLALPFIDEVPLTYLISTLKFTVALIKGLAMNNVTLDLSRIDQLVSQNVIRPLRKLAIAGVSTLPILRAASDLGIPVMHLGSGNFRLGWGAQSRLFSRSAVDADSAIGADVARRKDHTIRHLTAVGIPCPIHALVHSLEAAQAAAQKIGWPVVVKPADRERSEGVSTSVSDPNALSVAWQTARRWSTDILIEQQIEGTCFRLMVANKKMLYAVERKPRAVIGDGVNTIEQLLLADAEVQSSTPVWLRKKQVPLDEETISTLNSQGLGLGAIPEAGARIWLRKIESTEWGETTVDVTTLVHPDNQELAEKAARTLGLDNAGVDLMTSDISIPWWKSGGKVTEVNFRPHFGGTLAAQQRMNGYLSDLMPVRGRIPIYVYCGQSAALTQARQRMQIELDEGKFTVLCTAGLMEGPAGPMPFELSKDLPTSHRLQATCAIALQDMRLETLLVVVQDAGLLLSGFPFDSITDLQDVESMQGNVEQAGLLVDKLRGL